MRFPGMKARKCYNSCWCQGVYDRSQCYLSEILFSSGSKRCILTQLWKSPERQTNTSVSGENISMLVAPKVVASTAWSSSFVSASSCGLLYSDSSKPLPRTFHSKTFSKVFVARYSVSSAFVLAWARGLADMSSIGDLTIHWLVLGHLALLAEFHILEKTKHI